MLFIHILLGITKVFIGVDPFFKEVLALQVPALSLNSNFFNMSYSAYYNIYSDNNSMPVPSDSMVHSSIQLKYITIFWFTFMGVVNNYLHIF